VAYVEIEAFICANLVAGMEAGLLDPAPIWTDAKTFDARPFGGKIHGIIGGYPCTPFSLAGTRSGEDHPGHIYPAISRAIEASRPIWCLFENVSAHLTLGFDKVYKDLQRMGYSVEAGIYTAEEIGAPHERERLFILAISNTYLRSGNTGTKQMGWEAWPSEKSILANSDNAEWRAVNTSRSESEGQFDVSQKQEDANSSTQCGETLANQFSTGLEGYGLREGSAGTQFTMPAGISDTQWPARPGEQQHGWEEPRTIESGMGCTIDGYNFREDILRALGNSVVEQTAELAFIDLLNKHIKNLQL
jgi:DNA (cytosine-5)-methyltransferase 1